MKTPIIIALSIAGVLGTAGAAMAVNAGTLASFSQSNLGNAPTSLTTPTGTPTMTPTPSDDATEHATPEAEPSEHATPKPGDDTTKTTNGTTKSGSDDTTEHSIAPVPSVPSPSPTHHGDDGGSDDSHGSGGHGSDD